jgi:hypothetical protein
MDLDIPDDRLNTPIIAPVAPNNYLEDTPNVNEEQLNIELNEAVEVLLGINQSMTLNAASGVLEATASDSLVSELFDQPTTSNDVSQGYSNRPPSNASSVLENHEDTIRGITPITVSSTSSIVDPATIIRNAYPEIFDANQIIDDQTPSGSPTTVQVQLNMNPHSNTDTISEEDNDLSSINTEPPVGQYHTPLYELYHELRDITNLPM